MPKNTAIDQYISQQQPFAQEIMSQLRDVIHTASPEMSEAIKWRHPCFENSGLVCAMAAFKQHVTFSFFKGKLLDDSASIFSKNDNNELTSLKFKSLSEIPTNEILISYVQQAIALNSTPKPEKKKSVRKNKADLVIPDYFSAALADNQAAKDVFNNFSYSKQKDYIEWLTSAKREATRNSRLATAITWIAEGKSRNWKYENC